VEDMFQWHMYPLQIMNKQEDGAKEGRAVACPCRYPIASQLVIG
jgi:hypothetical protein